MATQRKAIVTFGRVVRCVVFTASNSDVFVIIGVGFVLDLVGWPGVKRSVCGRAAGAH